MIVEDAKAVAGSNNSIIDQHQKRAILLSRTPTPRPGTAHGRKPRLSTRIHQDIPDEALDYLLGSIRLVTMNQSLAAVPALSPFTTRASPQAPGGPYPRRATGSHSKTEPPFNVSTPTRSAT
jgi:hypothetical protein